jgi:hypothetical protein
MVINDRQDFVVAPIGQVGVDLVGVDERQKIHFAELPHRLDLAEVQAEQLDERTVLAMAELVTVRDRRLRDAQALRDVRLGDGTGNPVRIRVAASASANPRARSSAAGWLGTVKRRAASVIVVEIVVTFAARNLRSGSPCRELLRFAASHATEASHERANSGPWAKDRGIL